MAAPSRKSRNIALLFSWHVWLTVVFVFAVVLVFALTSPLRRLRGGIVGEAVPAFPSREIPDNIILSPAADSATGMAVNWRTSSAIRDGVVQYRALSGAKNAPILEKTAALREVTAPELASDSRIHCFSATLDGLVPNTKYQYRVGSKTADKWSTYRTFSTGPKGRAGFSFVFLGDVHLGHGNYQAKLEKIEQRRPDVAFYLFAGDLVNVGRQRNDWDEVLSYAGDLFARKPMAAALGNHDFQGVGGSGYRYSCGYFNFPGNGPRLPNFQNRDYTFVYGNVLFIVMDSNMDYAVQAEWLKGVLADAEKKGYDFKVCLFHHPIYDTKKNRDSWEIRLMWAPLLERYGVDLVLNGHEHSYLRTRKLRDGKPAGEGKPGVTHVMAVAGDNFYKAEKIPQAAVQFENIRTYQIIDIAADEGGRPVLRFKSYADDGKLMDEFELGRAQAGKK